MTTIFSSKEPVTVQRFASMYLAVAVTAALAMVAGAVAWGQADEKLTQVERRQDSIDDTVGAIRRVQDEGMQKLSGLEAQNEMMQRTQQRILDELVRMRAPMPSPRR